MAVSPLWHAQGSVTTPGGSRRFGSFAGRFSLASSNPTQHKEMLDNYDLLSPEQLRIGARKMRNELDNLYKAGQTCICTLLHARQQHILQFLLLAELMRRSTGAAWCTTSICQV